MCASNRAANQTASLRRGAVCPHRNEAFIHTFAGIKGEKAKQPRFMQITSVSVSQRSTLFATCSDGKTIQHLPGAGGNCAIFKCEGPDCRLRGDLLPCGISAYFVFLVRVCFKH